MTTAMIPARATETARAELRTAVDALVHPQTRDIVRDDGETSAVVAPALLSQLADDVARSASAADGAFAARSRPPGWVEAMQLLGEVDRVVGARHPGERCEAVHRWGQTCAALPPSTALIDAADRATRWHQSVRELLDPSPKHRARGVPCPACGAEKVWDRVDHGNDEHYTRPALSVDEHAGMCVCAACEASWGIELWAHLQQVLEQQRHETLAAPSWTAEVDDRTPHLNLPDTPVQCDERVRDESAPGYRSRRCPALLDRHGHCRNTDRHEDT